MLIGARFARAIPLQITTCISIKNYYNFMAKIKKNDTKITIASLIEYYQTIILLQIYF